MACTARQPSQDQGRKEECGLQAERCRKERTHRKMSRLRVIRDVITTDEVELRSSKQTCGIVVDIQLRRDALFGSSRLKHPLR